LNSTSARRSTRKRTAGAAVLIALATCLAVVAFTSRVRNEMVDFEVYRTAGARAAAGEPLYRASDEHYQFKYFPPFAFVFTPLAALPATTAKAIWFALSVALLFGLVALSVHELPSRVVPASLIVTATILTLGKFYARELSLGQANLLFGFVTVAALAQLQRRHDTGAGATFAAAAVVKPYALLFVPYLLVTRRFRAALICAVVLVLAMSSPILMYGIDGTTNLLVAWWETVATSTPANLTNQDNVSIAAMYTKWFGPGAPANALTLLTGLALLGMCAAAIAMRHGRTRPEYLEVALLLTLVALVSPQGWDYVLLLSTPAVMLIVNALPRLNRLVRLGAVTCLAAIGLTIYDVMGRAAYARFMALSLITVVYLGLIVLIVYVRARQVH
jgi:alpha-1,2-mannosyltransferase